MTYSVIIPTYNEEVRLRQCIDSVRRSLSTFVEIIVADGGSTDSTLAIANEAGVQVCLSDNGRGTQCDAGATIASGKILLFLHADTTLPLDALDILTRWFQDDDVQIGTFRLSFDSDDLLLRFYSIFTRFDSVFTRFGDQCIVVRKTFYDDLGGFSHWRLFEDVQLLQLARKRTIIHSFPSTVATSARRFLRRGVLRQQLHNGVSILRFLLGESPDRLAQSYDGGNQVDPGADLIVFARYPHPGKVKTRLARSLGDGLAAGLYRACVEHVFYECSRLPDWVRTHLFYSEREDEKAMTQWAPSAFRLVPQHGTTLGDRIENAFARIFRSGSQKAVILGTDIPDISAELIQHAITALNVADVVIGPTHDGGYYLLGMKRHIPELFDGIPWSTDAVCERTLATVASLGLRVEILHELFDIDTEADLRYWCRTGGGSESHPLRIITDNIQYSSFFPSN
jgi:rSAM/selenodomain-associated transferase 2/rSAM/selenodomain-associated transferase 1